MYPESVKGTYKNRVYDKGQVPTPKKISTKDIIDHKIYHMKPHVRIHMILQCELDLTRTQ